MGWGVERCTTCFYLARSALLLPLALAACESGARQDPLFVRGATTATIMPTIAQARDSAHHAADPQGGEGKVVSSPVAYEEPPTPSYSDRPLSDNLATSLEVADYARLMEREGLMVALRGDGPYTVFAIPNQPLEAASMRFPGGLTGAAGQPQLKRVLAYSVVRGRWDEARLRRKMARMHSDALALKTLAGAPLIVRRAADSGQLVISNPSGQTTRLWLTGVPQANGVLYFTQGVLSPDGPA